MKIIVNTKNVEETSQKIFDALAKFPEQKELILDLVNKTLIFRVFRSKLNDESSEDDPFFASEKEFSNAKSLLKTTLGKEGWRNIIVIIIKCEVLVDELSKIYIVQSISFSEKEGFSFDAEPKQQLKEQLLTLANQQGKVLSETHLNFVVTVESCWPEKEKISLGLIKEDKVEKTEKSPLVEQPVKQ